MDFWSGMMSCARGVALLFYFLPFGDDAQLLHGVFGFFFQASSYGMFGRLEMVLDLIMLLLLQTLFIKWFL